MATVGDVDMAHVSLVAELRGLAEMPGGIVVLPRGGELGPGVESSLSKEVVGGEGLDVVVGQSDVALFREKRLSCLETGWENLLLNICGEKVGVVAVVGLEVGVEVEVVVHGWTRLSDVKHNWNWKTLFII